MTSSKKRGESLSFLVAILLLHAVYAAYAQVFGAAAQNLHALFAGVEVEEVVEDEYRPAVESDFVIETVAAAFEKETAAEELVEKEVEPVEESKVEAGTIGVIE